MRFICLVICIRISFFLEADYYSVTCVHHILFIYSFLEGQLNCFHILIIVNYAATNMHIWIYSSTCLNKPGVYPEVELLDYYQPLYCINRQTSIYDYKNIETRLLRNPSISVLNKTEDCVSGCYACTVAHRIKENWSQDISYCPYSHLLWVVTWSCLAACWWYPPSQYLCLVRFSCSCSRAQNSHRDSRIHLHGE